MVELVDTRDLKSRDLRVVWVQVPLLVLKTLTFMVRVFCLRHFTMAIVYILYSNSIDQFYTGSCLDLAERLEAHRKQEYSTGFTRRASDWKVFFKIDNLTYQQARKIEQHIKGMKSKIYIKNLITYPEVSEKLVLKYI
jgi:putative endonuclease